MRAFLSSILGPALWAAPALAQLPGTTNDAWERALPIGGGVSQWSTVGATQHGSSPCDVGDSPDVWFVFTPQDGGPAILGAQGILGFDTVISLFTLENGELVLLGCDDDSGPLDAGQPTSRLEWNLSAQRPYYLRVSGKNGAVGSFSAGFGLFSPPIRPVNGTRERPLPIRAGLYQGYTRPGPGESNICFQDWESAWYRYTPIQSGVVILRTCALGLLTPSDASTSVEANGSIVSCSFCDPPTSNGFQAQAGTEYLIRVGPSNGGNGVFALQLTGPPTAGETCLTALPIGEGHHLLTLEGTSPSGDSSCAAGDPSLFFRYTASASGTFSISTCTTTTAAIGGYGVDAAITLYSACPADLATELDCNKGSVLCVEGFRPQPWLSTTVTQGQEILIRVSARAEGQLGPIELEVQLEPHLAACFGDGSASPCPCGNVGAHQRGCDNSLGTGGAKLSASGSASLFDNTLSLISTGGPRETPMLLLEGLSPRNGGMGTPFADGLLCVEGDLRRRAAALSVEGVALFGPMAGHSLNQVGSTVTLGTRWYQGYYRNPGPFCSDSPANLTNAVRVTWSIFP